MYPNLTKENRRMLTCNWLDLQTLGSQPFMLKNLPDHCCLCMETNWWSTILILRVGTLCVIFALTRYIDMCV